MAITRRQFVTRLGALAAAAGFSQVEASKIMDAVAYQGAGYGGAFGKPRVVWLISEQAVSSLPSGLRRLPQAS